MSGRGLCEFLFQPFKRGAFGDYRPGKQDVVIATYPKSGTTWAMQIVYQISFYGDGDLEHIDRAADEIQRRLSGLFELSRIGVQVNPSEEVALGEIFRSPDA